MVLLLEHLLAVHDDDALVAVVNALTSEVVAYAILRIDTVHLGDASGLNHVNNHVVEVDGVLLALGQVECDGPATLSSLAPTGIAADNVDLSRNVIGPLGGNVDVANGASVAAALLAKFQKAGVYMVKQGSKFQTVRVTR